MTAMIKDVGRNLASLIGLFFVSLVAFIVCATLFSVGRRPGDHRRRALRPGGLPAWWPGLVARVTKQLLAYAGVDLPAHALCPTAGPGFGARRRLQDPQSWRDLLHVLISFVHHDVLVLDRRQLGRSVGSAV